MVVFDWSCRGCMTWRTVQSLVPNHTAKLDAFFMQCLIARVQPVRALPAQSDWRGVNKILGPLKSIN